MCQYIHNLLIISFPLIIGISGSSFYMNDGSDLKSPVSASDTVMERVNEVVDGKCEDQ